MNETMCPDIIIENARFRLVVGCDCVAKSLICKDNGIELLMPGVKLPLFSLTEARPFHNEIKLAHPNKRTTFWANSLRREGDKLIVGFEVLRFEAVVSLKTTPAYVAFTLEDFVITKRSFGNLCMDLPPVEEFCLLQLPIANRKYFGEWLNVSHDDEVAVNVLATSPYPEIDSERRDGYRILYGKARRGIKLKGCTAALIVSPKAELMDCIDALEVDYDLPRGVQSRRADTINRSVYWTENLTPQNVDAHISYAKRCGFSMMLLYNECFFLNENYYSTYGNYDYRPEYPNGLEDVRAVVQKIKAAGITPGLHILHSHIGMKSRYLTPEADHRLNLTRYFTLSKPLGLEETTVYVEENPEGAVMHPKCRILKFGTELIYYDGYTTEYPYCFTGCVRGYNDTYVKTHELGTIGGILDVSEHTATSAHLNQYGSLQDEIADKMAELYNVGFEFIYFDGSEATNPPFDFHVANAQYRVYKKLGKEPLFGEGAAKSHFSWHMLSGGNAFDIFKPPVFKEKLVEFPAEEAPRMAQDLTRLNFGWWKYFDEIEPDMYEFGTSRAAAWDCPVTMMCNFEAFEKNPRTEDNFEIIRRWEDVRAKKWLTQAQKDALKNTDQEHILLKNGAGAYELLPYDRIADAAGGDTRFSAYVFERGGKTWVVCWHNVGSGTLTLPLAGDVAYLAEVDGAEIPMEQTADGLRLPVAGRQYLCTDLPRETVTEAFRKAKLSE